MAYSNNNCARTERCQCANCRAKAQEVSMENFPVGMTYVPWQLFGEPYSPEIGFLHGTLFPSLNLPFLCGNPACGNRPRQMVMPAGPGMQHMRGGRP